MTAIEQAYAALDEWRNVAAETRRLYKRRAVAILAAYDEGCSVAGIARRLGVGRKVVQDAINRRERERIRNPC